MYETIIYIIVIAFLVMLMILTTLVFVVLWRKIGTGNTAKQNEKLYLLRMSKEGKLQIRRFHGNVGYWKDYPR